MYRCGLKKLGWPHIDNIEDWSLSDILFTPGEGHLNLLEWVLGKCTQCSAVCDHHNRIKDLTEVACSLCMCGSTDVDVIEGSADRSKQIKFWNSLLRMATAICPSDEWQSNSNSNEASNSFLESFAHNFEHRMTLMDSKVDLFSNDITSLFPEHQRLDESDINENILWLNQKIQNREEELDALKTKHEDILRESDQTRVPDGFFETSLNDLQDATNVFDRTFDQDIKQWTCDKTIPSFNELGPTFKNASSKLNSFCILLNDMSSMKNSYRHLENDASPDEDPIPESIAELYDEKQYVFMDVK